MSFIGPVRGLFSRGKDSGASYLAARILNRHFSHLGHMINLSIDSLQKKAHVEVLLKGEREPLTVTVESYEVVREAEQDFIILKEATSSREWVNVILESTLIGKRLPLPEKYGTMIRLIL